jgi:hypothetical protein
VLLTASVRALEEAIGDVTLTVGPVAVPAGERKHHILLNGQRYELSPDRFAYIRFFAERLKESKPALTDGDECVSAMLDWLQAVKAREPLFGRMAQSFLGVGSPAPKDEWKTPFGAADLSRRLLDLRKHLKDKIPGGGHSLAAAMPIDRRWSLSLDSSRVTLL